jgi:hypothetical protein
MAFASVHHKVSSSHGIARISLNGVLKVAATRPAAERQSFSFNR